MTEVGTLCCEKVFSFVCMVGTLCYEMVFSLYVFAFLVRESIIDANCTHIWHLHVRLTVFSASTGSW